MLKRLKQKNNIICIRSNAQTVAIILQSTVGNCFNDVGKVKFYESMFPNLYCCLRLLGTVPVTTCECERSISSLRRLKSYLRRAMGEDRLNGLVALHIHKHLPLDLENMIDDFAAMHPRRMMMTNI